MTTSNNTMSYTHSLAGIMPEHLRGFFVGWPNPPTPATHLRLLRQSTLVTLAQAMPDGRVVGFASALSDGVLTAYIALLEVLPSHQRQGIGSSLLARTLEQLRHLYAIDLLCDPALQSFYARHSMRPLCGMALRHYDQQQGAD